MKKALLLWLLFAICIFVLQDVNSQIITEEVQVQENGGKTQIDDDVEISGNLVVSGDVISANVDDIKSFDISRTLSTSWQDTGIKRADLSTGTYMIQVFVNDFSVGGGHYIEYYSGLMSWYEGGTNSQVSDEIPLHRAGHAPNHGRIYLRTERHYGVQGGNLVLQIRANYNASGPFTYTFKFKRLI